LARRRRVAYEANTHFAGEFLKAANHRLMAKRDKKFVAPCSKAVINMTAVITSIVARDRADV